MRGSLPSQQTPPPTVYVSTWRKRLLLEPYGSFEMDAALTDYPARVQRAGAVALQMPRDLPGRAGQILEGADALVMVGGDDVDPAVYGQENRGSGRTDPEADAFDVALIAEAHRRSLPLFAICRGHQLLNVALGGTLLQDIPQDRIRHSAGRSETGEEIAPEHEVSVTPDSRVLGPVLAGAGLGPSIRVNSLHHQAVDICAPGLRVSARAEDGTVEGLESIDPDWLVLSVQWHPEKMEEHQFLFDWFVGRLRR